MCEGKEKKLIYCNTTIIGYIIIRITQILLCFVGLVIQDQYYDVMTGDKLIEVEDAVKEPVWWNQKRMRVSKVILFGAPFTILLYIIRS